MNANELAEGINSPHNACCYRDKCRQQQAEIEALKAHPVKELDRELLNKTIIDQQNEIKDLRKNLDVALMIVNHPVKELKQIKGVNYYVDAPTVKELTDEEILEYSDVFALDNSPLYEFTGNGLILFAKAILRKAQEK